MPSDEKSEGHMRDIIVWSKLWLSSPVHFNDPFDMAVLINAEGSTSTIRQRLKDALKRQRMRWGEMQRRLPLMVAKSSSGIVERVRNAYQKQRKSAGVCSFGGDPKSILMWSHYSSNHEGVCLVFEVAKDVNVFGGAFPVDYNDEYPVVNWMDEDYSMVPAMLRKHEKWSYEKERRIIHLEKAGQSLSFEPEALRAIIIGCRCTPNTIKVLKEILRERSNLGKPSPKLYRAVQHKSKYRLVIQKFE